MLWLRECQSICDRISWLLCLLNSRNRLLTALEFHVAVSDLRPLGGQGAQARFLALTVSSRGRWTSITGPKGTVPSMRAPASDLTAALKPCLLMPSQWGVGHQPVNWGVWGTDIVCHRGAPVFSIWGDRIVHEMLCIVVGVTDSPTPAAALFRRGGSHTAQVVVNVVESRRRCVNLKSSKLHHR